MLENTVFSSSENLDIFEITVIIYTVMITIITQKIGYYVYGYLHTNTVEKNTGDI